MQAGKPYQGSLIERKSSNCKPFSRLRRIKFTEKFRPITRLVRLPCCMKADVQAAGGHSKLDHRANAFPLVHQIKGVVDSFQRKFVGDHWIELDRSGEILLDVVRQLRSSFDAAKSRAAPNPP